MDNINTLLNEAVAEFTQAKETLSFASDRVSVARREETEAMNRVNDAQKKIDELIKALKEGAPRDSDWYRAKHKGQPE